jgi:hypothetical protein
MEEPLYILIDPDRRVIHLFGAQTRTIPFMYAFTLPSIISGKSVQFLQNSGEMMGDDVVDYMAGLLDQNDAPTEALFFRSKAEGYVRIADIRGLVFAGPKDSKPFSTWGYDIFDRSPNMRKLLGSGAVEILTESEAKNLRRGRIDPGARDKALDSIILNKSVKDFEANEDMFGNDGGNGDEITNETEVLTDAEQIIREHKIGRRPAKQMAEEESKVEENG